MKYLHYLTTPAALIGAAFTAQVSAADLVINLTSIEKSGGNILMAIYDSEDNFNATPLHVKAEPAIEGDMQFTLPNMLAGDYAVMLYHDLNGNGELDSNLLGMPKEPWGASLQGKSLFGPPAWSDTRFTLSADGTTITITLN